MIFPRCDFIVQRSVIKHNIRQVFILGMKKYTSFPHKEANKLLRVSYTRQTHVHEYFEIAAFSCVFHPNANGVLGHWKLLEKSFECEYFQKLFVYVLPWRRGRLSCCVATLAFVFIFVRHQTLQCLCWLHWTIFCNGGGSHNVAAFNVATGTCFVFSVRAKIFFKTVVVWTHKKT